MKHIKTITAKDKTVVVLREDEKTDGEYHFKITIVWHWDGSVSNRKYYPRTIADGLEYVEREVLKK